MIWASLLKTLEDMEDVLEHAPAAETDVEHYVRMALANHLAAAREALEALSKDEEAAQ